MFEPQFGNRHRQIFRLVRIELVGLARLHIAKGAGAGAGIAQNHHRGVPFAPAFADIGAGGFLAHGVEFVFTHQRVRIHIALRLWGFHPNPVGFF